MWLNVEAIFNLFNVDKSGVLRYINNIYKYEELDESSTHNNFLLVQKEGNREVQRNIDYYNLDMIIALGYRVQLDVAVRFRILAIKKLHEYIQKRICTR